MEIIGKRCVKFHDDMVELSAAVGGGVRVYKGEELLFETQGERLEDLVEAQVLLRVCALKVLRGVEETNHGLHRYA